METIKNKIEKIMTNNPGKIFSINDFLNRISAAKKTIQSVLYRLVAEKKIARLINGLYTKPKYCKLIQEHYYPSPDELANKLAENFSWTIMYTGDAALNYTGLSTQVPNTHIYITDGKSRVYEYQGIKIIFKHTANRNITGLSYALALIIQAIKALGKNNLTEKNLRILADFAKKIKADLKEDITKLAYWIKDVVKKISVSEL